MNSELVENAQICRDWLENSSRAGKSPCPLMSSDASPKAALMTLARRWRVESGDMLKLVVPNWTATAARIEELRWHARSDPNKIFALGKVPVATILPLCNFAGPKECALRGRIRWVDRSGAALFSAP
jgi:hypothetical protein